MENIESPIVEKDIKKLRSELDVLSGTKPFCDRRCVYILAIVGLALFMFLFGVLTLPAKKTLVVTEVPVVIDPYAAPVVQPELNARLLSLHESAKGGRALTPTVPGTATEPRILSWTPDSIGRLSADGQIVPVNGTYEIPGGWYGAIRLLSDKKEIGSVVVDARKNTAPMQGAFSVIPAREEGQHLVHLAFDAVNQCRIACAPGDQLCQRTNAAYCDATFDNQAFLSYAPVTSESLPPVGQCVKKTFVAGPKYSPQEPEDYNMCARGEWNTPIARDVLFWLTSKSGFVSTENASKVSTFIYGALRDPKNLPPSVAKGEVSNISWEISYNPGDYESNNVCSLSVVVRVDCD